MSFAAAVKPVEAPSNETPLKDLLRRSRAKTGAVLVTRSNVSAVRGVAAITSITPLLLRQLQGGIVFELCRMPARFIATTIVSAALFVAASASAQEAHGVIVFGEADQGDGVAYGFAWNFAAKSTAHAEAVNACASSGGTNCIQLAWFQNGCGALAIDQHGNAQGKPGMTREQAEARALQTCETAGGAGCNIVGSLCATPDGDPGTYSGSESVLPVEGSQVTVTASADEQLTREERVLVQESLNALGFDAGPADGVFGQRTRAAIREWQTANGHDATGHVARDQFAFLTAFDVMSIEDGEEETQQVMVDVPSYDTCMTFCLDEHSFSYCHPVCDGSAGNAGTVGETDNTGGTESAVPTSRYCGTLEDRRTVIRAWIKENYGPWAGFNVPINDDLQVFEVDFSPYEDGEYTDFCIGIVTFDDACQVAVMGEIECLPYD